MFSKGDRVYLKYSGMSKLYKMFIEEVNNTHAIVKLKDIEHNFIFKKFSLELLTKENSKHEEAIEKGDLVFCIINKVYKEKGIVLDVKDTFLKVMLSESLKQRNISKNNVIVIKYKSV